MIVYATFTKKLKCKKTPKQLRLPEGSEKGWTQVGEVGGPLTHAGLGPPPSPRDPSASKAAMPLGGPLPCPHKAPGSAAQVRRQRGIPVRAPFGCFGIPTGLLSFPLKSRQEQRFLSLGLWHRQWGLEGGRDDLEGILRP